MVKASPATNFQEVVVALCICPQIGMTRAAFHALPKRERNEVKQVAFFVAACFKASPSKRVYTEATHCNLLFIDIDDSTHAAPFFHNPELLNAALNGYSFAAYTTASHTPEHPRMRVVVEAEHIPLSHYPDAVSSVAALLGLPSLTRESKVAVQPMFLPTQFAGDGLDEHPLIARDWDGRAFTVKDITNPNDAFGDEALAPVSNHEIDVLPFLRAPVPEITLQVAKGALNALDPDCSYMDWVEVAFALAHQFGVESEAAYELFDEWSAKGNNYPGHDGKNGTRAKWESASSTLGRSLITIRSLLKRAVAAGWDDKKVKERCFLNTQKWMEEAPSADVLTEEGIQRINNTPLLSSMQEDVLIKMMVRLAKQRFEYIVSATAIRKDLLKLRNEEKKRKQETIPEDKHPAWAKGFCYVKSTKQFFRPSTGERTGVEAFNTTNSRYLMPTDPQQKELGRPTTLPSDYVTNILTIPTVDDYAYDPSKPEELYFTQDQQKYVNTYSPTFPKEDPEHEYEAGELFMGHLKHLIKETEYRNTVVDFLAYQVQSPGRKVRYAVLIQGVEGAGKTFIAEAMKAVLGHRHVNTVDGAAIKSSFNDWAVGYQFVVIEEVYVSGGNRKDVMNSLKPLITNPDVAINQKFRSSRTVANATNYLMFTNHHDALALDNGDRRYFVIKSALQTKQQVAALGPDHFPALFTMLTERAGALRSWLLHWQISPDFNPDAAAPHTHYKDEVVEDTADDLTSAVRAMMAEGDHPLIQYDIVSTHAIKAVLTLGGYYKFSDQWIGRVLREEGMTKAGRKRVGEELHYIWARPGVVNALDIAKERMLSGAKNLCMELMF